MVLATDFYRRADVVQVAKDLIGKKIITEINGYKTSGRIVETEAYAGIDDKASHAYNHRRTQRTEIMYADGGVAYVYLCYGVHHLFNVVTNIAGIPHAVLIRAIEPLEGIDTMLQRRKKAHVTPSLTAGPGVLSAALGIHTKHTGVDLRSSLIRIEDMGIVVPESHLVITTRVGVEYAGKDALLPYRFYEAGNPFVSKK